jgi:hypothetical protein
MKGKGLKNKHTVSDMYSFKNSQRETAHYTQKMRKSIRHGLLARFF